MFSPLIKCFLIKYKPILNSLEKPIAWATMTIASIRTAQVAAATCGAPALKTIRAGIRVPPTLNASITTNSS